MKHNLKITIVLLVMFIITQLIGLWVVNYYLQPTTELPYGLEPPEIPEQDLVLNFQFLISLIIFFAIVIMLIFILMNRKSVWFMRIWFFVVVALALGITLNAVASRLLIPYAFIIAGAIGLILAYIKIFKRHILTHNITELMIYPGISAIFVPILNIWTIIILLVIISIYDIWAVWHSGIMQKMAKFQINKIGVLGGFFVPYASKKMKEKIKALKLKYKSKKKIPDSVIKEKKIRVQLAILGGGDVIFPIITAGVFLKTFGNIWATLIVTLGATLALLWLFVFAKKKKFYPAMPFITAGLLLGMIAAWLVVTLV